MDIDREYRFEASSDGVRAIMITIMVLELEIPSGSRNRVGMGVALVRHWVAQERCVGHALLWLIPVRRIERALDYSDDEKLD